MSKKRYSGLLQTDVYGIAADEAHVAHLSYDSDATIAMNDAGVHAVIAGMAETQTIISDIQNPPCPRNLIVTPGGTVADVAAGDVEVFGTNIANEEISEKFTFAADASAAVIGTKAFKTVTKIVIHEQNGTGCTFKIGYGIKFGLPYKLSEKPLTFASVDGTIETTAPTLTIDCDSVENNTISLNTAPAGKKTDVYFVL